MHKLSIQIIWFMLNICFSSENVEFKICAREEMPMGLALDKNFGY